MTSAPLTQFLIDVTRGRQKTAFAANREEVIALSRLDENLQTAIRQEDIGALWIARAHPMALLYFARACGWPPDKYYKCISEADGRMRAMAG